MDNAGRIERSKLDGEIIATLARYVSIIGLPIIAAGLLWLITTVNQSATKLDTLAGQIDLKFQLRDQRLDTIDGKLRDIISRMDQVTRDSLRDASHDAASAALKKGTP